MESQTGSSKKKPQSHCCVLGCKVNYKNKSNKVSIFKAPNDPEKLEEWRKVIPTAGKAIHSMCSVCEFHFEPHFIERYYRTVVNDEEILIPRGRPCLSKDAVPSIFPDVPKSKLQKCTTKKRQQTTEKVTLDVGPSFAIAMNSSTPISSDVHRTASHVKLENNQDFETPTDSLDDRQTAIHVKLENEQNSDTPIGSPPVSIDAITSLSLPSLYWTCIKYQRTPNVVCFATWSTFTQETDEADKRVVVNLTDSELLCSIYFKHVKVISVKINDLADLEKILSDLNGQHLCKGIGSIDEFSFANKRPQIINKCGNLWSKQCHGSVKSYGIACSQCRYQRKLQVNYKYKAKIRQTKPAKLKYKMGTLVKSARRLKRRALILSAKLKQQRKIQKKQF